MDKLILHTGSKSKEYELNGEATIGRQKGNTIRINEGKASRNHCKVVKSGDGYVLEDLESSNGTRVNGRKVRRVTLKHGDTIQIGNTRFVFETGSGAAGDDGAPKASGASSRRTNVSKREFSSDKSTRIREKERADPLIGKQLGGYKILARLGAGGMGTVYKANQLSMDREVAFKVLKTDLSSNREFAKGFLREARVAGQLTHPGLVQVHDVGEEGGTLYFSMEYIEGQSVYDILKKDGRVSLAQTLEVAVGVTEALAHAETHRVVHQDIKPHNIMVDKRGTVKLMDLGLATTVGQQRKSGGGKKDNVIMGTPHYMAPEQSQKGDIDSRTDLYALGVSLYHMLTGQVPFDGPNGLVILTQHVINERPDPRELDITIPESLAELIQEMMAIEPKDRPANPKAVLERLKKIKAEVDRTSAMQRKIGGGVIKKRARLKSGFAPVPKVPQRAPAVVHSAGTSSKRIASPERPTRAGTAAAPADHDGQQLVQYVKYLVGLVALLIVFMAAKSFIPGGSSQTTKRPRKHDSQLSNRPDLKNGTGTATNPVGAQNPGNGENGGQTVAPPNGAAHSANPVTPENPDDPTPPDQVEDQAAADPEALKALKKAIDARDRAMQSNNFTGARAALRQFLGTYRTGEVASRARKELNDTERLIKDVVVSTLAEAKDAAAKKKYRLAAARATLLMSADPYGQGGKESKALLQQIDVDSEARFNEVNAQADHELGQGRLDKVMQVLGAGMDELGGTKWASALASRMLQMALANKFLKACETARAKQVSQGKQPEVLVTNFDDKKVSGKLDKIDGLSVTADLGGVKLPYSFKKMRPDEIYSMVEGLGVEKDHLGMANLFSLLKNEKLAKSELDRALKDPAQAELAARLAARLSGVTNLYVYDFSKWQHQVDWEATSGAWATVNDKFVLESSEGGDTELKTDAIGGPFSARDAVVSMEFQPKDVNAGFFIAMEFGTQQKNLAVVFNLDGFSLQANTDEMKQATGAWKPGGATQLELSIKGNEATLSLNGKKAASVEAAGIENLRGTIYLHVREAQCQFDNIVLRNQE